MARNNNGGGEEREGERGRGEISIKLWPASTLIERGVPLPLKRLLPKNVEIVMILEYVKNLSINRHVKE